MKKYIALLIISFFIILPVSCQTQKAGGLSSSEGIPQLTIYDAKLDSIVNVVDSLFNNAKSPHLWQAVELKMIEQSKGIYIFQFTGFVFIPKRIDLNNYDGIFRKGYRIYIVRINDSNSLTKFFHVGVNKKFDFKEFTPFIMENPVWVFSYQSKKYLHLEKVYNNQILKEI